MRTELLLGIVLIAVIGGALLLVESGSNSNVSASSDAVLIDQNERTNDEGAVTIALSYMDPSQSSEYGDEIAFDTTINTHSSDISQYQLDKLSYLVDSSGNKYTPSGWVESEGSGGHHRKGVLLFSESDDSGAEILSNGKYFEIIVKDVDGIPKRTFRWDI
ncbi:MAG: hypothetical protein M8353_03910 [ANME-2 cluster archaeon]|nr:hypothetical protein [ANME-2 cluster archaeon]